MMQLTKELFVIPNGETFLLYAPLKRALAEVNDHMIALLKTLQAGEDVDLSLLDTLRRVGIVTDGETPVAAYVPKKGFDPTSATLVPSLDCNLRCAYCYARAGETIGRTMDMEVAKCAVDLIMLNNRVKGRKQVELEFHGGGEPFLAKNIPLVKQIVTYFRDQAELNNLEPKVVGTTNGVVSRSSLEWIASHFNVLNVSFDGPQDIQDKQRPQAHSHESFATVRRTVEYLESRSFKYHLRATITKDSVSRMSEIVEFFACISRIDTFALEPLFACGRCATTMAEAPDPADYLRNLILARKVGKTLGRAVHYSGAVVEGAYDCFCSSLDSGVFCVLPDGNVTSCLEVCRESDPRANVFMIGKYDRDARGFVFFEDKIRTLRSRNVGSIPHCRDCFAKYNCAGDCPAKVHAQSGSLFDTSTNTRCEMTRGIIKDILCKKLATATSRREGRDTCERVPEPWDEGEG